MTAKKRWSREYLPRDDALHYYPDPRWWEMWYFDAMLDNGYMLAGSFCFGSVRPPANADARFIEIALYDPKGDRRMVRMQYPKEQCSASEETCKVVMGPNIFEGEIPKYHLRFSEKGQGCDLIFESEVEGLVDAGVKLTGVIESIPVARARVSGTLTWDNQTMEVEGRGRHEHNWPLPPDFPPLLPLDAEYLIWTNIWLDDWTILFLGGYRIRKEGGQPYGTIVAYKKDKIVAISHKGGVFIEKYNTDKVNIKYPQSFTARWEDPGIADGEINFKVKRVIEFWDLTRRLKPFQRWFAVTYVGMPTYHRLGYDYDAKIEIAGEKVTGEGSHWCEYHRHI